jgi:hypothetical protein
MSLPPPSPSSLRYRPWWCLFVARLSPTFVVPTICRLSALAFAGVVVCWCCRSLSLAFAGIGVRCRYSWRWHSRALAFASVGVGFRCWLAWALAWHSLSLVVPASIVISATISPYEQWLAGGVVALGDVALGSGVVSCCCHCCCPETGPVATLRAEARSGSVGLGRKTEAGRQQVGDESRF